MPYFTVVGARLSVDSAYRALELCAPPLRKVVQGLRMRLMLRRESTRGRDARGDGCLLIDWPMMTSPNANTKREHDLAKTHDWVVVYHKDSEAEEQATAVTESSGALKGERVVRGREQECQRYHAREESGARS